MNSQNVYVAYYQLTVDGRMEIKSGHLKILRALAERDGLTKEDLARVVGNRNLAVKYRKELLRAGLIYQDEDDRFHLAARSHEWLYFNEVLRFLEDVFRHSCNRETNSFAVFDDGSIAVFEKGSPTFRKIEENKPFMSFGVLSDDYAKNRPDLELSFQERREFLHLILKISRDIARLRKTLIEFRERAILASLPEDERKVALRYRKNLEVFHELCIDILSLRIEQRIAEKDKMVRWFIEKNVATLAQFVTTEYLVDCYTSISTIYMSREALMLELEGMRRLVLENVDETQKDKVEKVEMLYRELSDEKAMNAFLEFIGKLQSLPRMCCIVPMSFKGHLSKFAKIAKEMHEKANYEKLYTQFAEEFYKSYIIGVDEKGCLVFLPVPYLIEGVWEPYIVGEKDA